MSSFVKVSENLFITEQSVVCDTVVDTRQSVNHIWIYDRSYSMSGSLPNLIDQLVALSRDINTDDTITIGWFSGEGDYNFILKGFKITSDRDYKVLESVIRKNSGPVSCTCFSEILADVKTVVDDLSVFSDVFSLHFFTDGFPMVSDYSGEIKNIFSAIDTIKGKITTAMLVGYGNYYNKPLLTLMAQSLGAMLIHSSVISEYSNSATRLLEHSGGTSPKQEVIPIVSDAIAIYTVTDSGVALYSVNDDDKLYVSPNSDGSETTIFYITKTEPSCDFVEISGVDLEHSHWGAGIYGGAFVMTQQTKTDVALEIAGAIGDVAIIDAITNAFTIEEHGRVESTIEGAIHDFGNRFVSGRAMGYLPPVDAFCVFDVLTKLMEDDESYFYPYSRDFKYDRVGKKSVQNDTYPSFEANSDVKCGFTDLVWHQSRLNLSVKTTISGTVALKGVEGHSTASMGFSDHYPVFVWRNYTFIKDGNVNVKKLRISSSKDTYEYFCDQNIVEMSDGVSADSYVIDISLLPSINRALAEGNTSAKSLAGLVGQEKKLQAKIKTYKWYFKNDCDVEVVAAPSSWTDDQVDFLMANGVDMNKGGVFSPKVETIDSGDFYVTKTFNIKVKKVSSLPAVSKVLGKIEDGKNRTLSESLLEPAIDSYQSIQETLYDPTLRAGWLESEIGKANTELKGIRQGIQRTKFAIIMGNHWFDEFDSRDETTIESGEFTMDFRLGTETVKI